MTAPTKRQLTARHVRRLRTMRAKLLEMCGQFSPRGICSKHQLAGIAAVPRKDQS